MVAFLVLALLGEFAGRALGTYTIIRRYGWDQAIFKGRAPVKFGTPLTLEENRAYSVNSNNIRMGYELFFHWLNTVRGGIKINGKQHPAELIMMNDDSSKAQVYEAAEYLIDHLGVELLLGPYSSGLTNQSSAVAHMKGKTLLASGAASAFVFEGRPQSFGTSTPANEFFAAAFPMFAAQKNPPKTVAFVQENVGFTKFACSSIGTLSAKHGFTVILSITVTKHASEDEVSKAVTALKAAKPDVVFSCNYNTVCKRLIQASKNQTFNPKAFVLTTCVPSPDFWGDLKMDGLHVMGSTPWTENLAGRSQLTNFTAMEFYDMFKKRFGVIPHYNAAAAWTACAAYVYAIESTNSLKPKVIADFLRNLDVRGVYGRISFNSIGLCKNPMKIVEHQTVSASIDPALIIVAPVPAVGKKPTYPKPSWYDLNCLDPSTDFKSVYGYMPSKNTCTECARGMASSAITQSDGSIRRICEPCGKGTALSITGKRGECQACRKGTFWCGAGWQAPTYGPWVKDAYREEAFCLGGSGSVSVCRDCPAGRYTDVEGEEHCKECPAGKHNIEPGSSKCVNCSANIISMRGEYSAYPGRATSCSECPKGALCEPDAQGLYSQYTNDAGYYLVKETTYKKEFDDQNLVLGKLYPCPHGEGKACLAREKCYVNEDSGRTAMEGPLCGTCKNGYAKGESLALCAECPSRGASWGLAFSSQLIIFVVTCWLSFGQFIKDPRAIMPTHMVILRQFLNYIHITSVVFQYSALSSFGDSVVKQLGVAQYLAGSKSPVGAAVGAECYLKYLSPDMDVYKAWIIAGLLMVPMWMAFNALFFGMIWGCCKLCKCARPQGYQFVVWLTLNCFVIQPRLTQLFLVPFECRYVDEIRLMTQPSVNCNGDDIGGWQTAGFLGLVCYSLGIPLTIICILRYFKMRNRLQSVECVRMFGFLFQGLKPEFYYFEALNMIRKVVYQMASNHPWLSPKPSVSDDSDEEKGAHRALTSMTLMFISIGFLVVHLRCKPFDAREFNILHSIESAMLWAVLITCLIQSWLFLSDHAWIFTDVTSDKERNKDWRNHFCTMIFFVFHARYFVLVFWGLVGKSIRRTQRWQTFVGGNTYVKVEEDGLITDSLSDGGRACLADCIRSVAMTQLRNRGRFHFKEFNDLVRKICVETFYQFDRDAFGAKNPIDGFKLRVLGLFQRLKVPDAVCAKVQGRVTVMQDVKDQGWLADPYYQFDPKDLPNALGKDFGVEDVQMAVIRSAWRDAQEARHSGFKNEIFSFADRVRKSAVGPGQLIPSSANQGEAYNKNGTEAGDPNVVPHQTVLVEGDPPSLPSTQPGSVGEPLAAVIEQVTSERDSLQKAFQAKDRQLQDLKSQRDGGETTEGDGDGDVEEWA